jgi:hypothetical protein
MYNERNLKKTDIGDKETNQQSQTTGHTEVKTKREAITNSSVNTT